MGMLTGKITVITGGTSGIGAAAARLFAAEGATVVIAGRRKDEGDRLAAELSLMAAEGATSEFVRTDVSAEADVQALTGHVTDRFGRPSQFPTAECLSIPLSWYLALRTCPRR
jgi:NAD(P)-dependent dehydrogenase (short-subunit alcohol dehydrogenase family)